jgi:hypothetical protein
MLAENTFTLSLVWAHTGIRLSFAGVGRLLGRDLRGVRPSSTTNIRGMRWCGNIGAGGGTRTHTTALSSQAGDLGFPNETRLYYVLILF